MNILVEANKGNAMLRFKIIDPETNQTVEMFSRKQKVGVSKEFVEYFEGMDVEVRMN